MTTIPPSASGDDRARIYNGRYELIRQIARGGTAQVYLARDLLLDRPVGLKVLFPELSSDPSFVERFRREAQAAANLSHPNIVPVFDWGESERTYFIVMEYVDGEPLSSIIRSQAPLPAARAAGIAADISKALSYAHRHGVVHRDVKPGNVLITRDGQVKVTDFGIARAVGADDSVTQTGLVMGTATYFSPEQAQGLGVDGRSDVYALGVVIYEMVTGRPPFSADTPVAIAYKHVSEPAVPPSELEPRVPVALEAIIMRAMAKQPAERYATSEDLYADLQRYSQGAPVMAMAGSSLGVGATQALGTGGLATQGFATAHGFGSTQAISTGATTAMPLGASTQAVQDGVRQHAELGDGQSGRPRLPKRRWEGWTFAALVLAAALALLVYTSGRALGYFGGNAYFHLPDEQSQNYQAAYNTLHKLHGLAVTMSGEHSSVAKGAVLKQNPQAGALVRKGSAVALVYSLGPVDVAVPPVADDKLAVAVAALKKAGLVPVPHGVKPTLVNEQPGYVTETNPPANELIAVHSKVTVYFIQGTYETPVPSVTGLTLQKAQQTLLSKGLTPGQEISQFSGTVPSGLVSGTNPAANTPEPAGTVISIIVSSGPPAVVPNVVGKDASLAEQAITSAGLTYKVVYTSGLTSDNNEVQSQSLPPNDQVNRGTLVTITVVQATASTTTTSQGTPTTTKKRGHAPPGHNRRG